MMGVTLHNKEEVLAAVIGGLSRVANAILATPAESRIDAIDAVAESYRKAARAFLDEEETEKWLEGVHLRLRAEVAARASEQQTNEPQDEAPSLVPASSDRILSFAVEARHALTERRRSCHRTQNHIRFSKR
jgi:methionine synthase I (cobalamin-dependent)